MKDLPRLYQNKTPKEFNNNRSIFYGMEKENNNSVWSSNDIRKKIDDIINSSSFIYCTTVNIVIGNETIVRKIVGIYNNNLITIDKEYIPIDNIKDIYK